MKFTDLWALAWRGLTRRPVRTLLTTLGITVAVASMVVFLSLGEGIRKVFSEQLGSIGPDIQISLTGLTQGMSLHPNVPQSLVKDLQNLGPEYGIKAVTPVVMAVRGGMDPKMSAIFYGLPPQAGITSVFPTVEIGSGRNMTPGDEQAEVAVIGAKAAENMHLNLGSTLRLNRRDSVKVIGILKSQAGLVDTMMFVPLNVLQRSEGAQDRLSLIAVKLNDPAQAKPVAKKIAAKLDVEAQTQSDILSFMDQTMRISDAVRFGISLIALIVGGLAVANTVMMGVFERTREFGTLRAMGARPAFVRALVLTESLLLALVGGVGGVILGLLGIWGVNAYTRQLADINAAALTPRLTLLALGISLLLGLLSGLLPARNASRMRITEALGRV